MYWPDERLRSRLGPGNPLRRFAPSRPVHCRTPGLRLRWTQSKLPMLTSVPIDALTEVASPVRLRSRFQIHAACRFWWYSKMGSLNFGFGTTRNVSSGGVCISSEGLPTMGAAVFVEIDLAWDNSGDGLAFAERVLLVEGRVVRHECNGHSGFAVMATQTSIEPSSLVYEGLV